MSFSSFSHEDDDDHGDHDDYQDDNDDDDDDDVDDDEIIHFMPRCELPGSLEEKKELLTQAVTLV